MKEIVIGAVALFASVAARASTVDDIGSVSALDTRYQASLALPDAK